MCKIAKLHRIYSFNPSVHHPEAIYIELTGACNLKCPNCPRTCSEHKRGNMPEELFMKVIGEIKTSFPETKELGFHFFGEILMMKNFEKLVLHARKEISQAHFGISTNLSIPNKEQIKKILLCGFDSIGIWPDSSSPRMYSELRSGSEYAILKENLRFLLDERDAFGKEDLGIHVGIVLNEINESAIREFIEEFQFVREKRNASIFAVESHDWAGQIDSMHVFNSVSKYSVLLRKPCYMPFSLMAINADGDVTVCCFDMDMRLKIGSIREDCTLKEVWASASASVLRKNIKKLSPPAMCKKCHNAYINLSPSAIIRKIEIRRKLKYFNFSDRNSRDRIP